MIFLHSNQITTGIKSTIDDLFWTNKKRNHNKIFAANISLGYGKNTFQKRIYKNTFDFTAALVFLLTRKINISCRLAESHFRQIVMQIMMQMKI